MTIENEQRRLSEGLDDESAALEHAAERLSERFPQVPREHIEELVEKHHEQFDGAPVRDFVPVLVEHDVKTELRAETGPIARA
ncbi:three-helix bundle dimerization domain-containing protein [Leifsonia sp. AG29]|uniref:three-helix bundle dimerization domain-containing protein n=1 Tax=Leifsonia sp. AG29 TaxID=2598860 RepID=UPI00131D0609|nr:hypothetical protein [Leifsonia sp. AG29]